MPSPALCDPRPRSVVLGTDAEVLNMALRFYARPSGPILDVTANRRRIWAGVEGVAPLFLDVAFAVRPMVQGDFLFLPCLSDSVSLLVFDPPHLPHAAGTIASRQQLCRDFGFNSPAGESSASLVGTFPEFLSEAVRVLKPGGLIFAKLKDYVHNHCYQWTLHKWLSWVEDVQGLTSCDLIVKVDPCGGNIRSGRWRRAHHLRNAHCWWVVVRKGRCEP